MRPAPSPLRTCPLDPDTGVSISAMCGATFAASAAMRSGSQVEAHSTIFGVPGVTAGTIAFVTTSSTCLVSNTASSTTSQCATSSSVAAPPPAFANAAVFAVSMSKPFGEKPLRRAAGAPARCRAGRAPRCRSGAPPSSGDLVEDREQAERIGDVRVVARVDLVGLPALALRPFEELAEAVIRARTLGIDVGARRGRLGGKL